MSNSSNSSKILDQKLWDEKIEIACEHLANALEKRVELQAEYIKQYQSATKFGSYGEPKELKISVNFCRDIFCADQKYPAFEKQLSTSRSLILSLSHDVFEIFKQGVGLCAEKFKTLLLTKLNEKYSKNLGCVLYAGTLSMSETDQIGSVLVQFYVLFEKVEVAAVPTENQSSSKQRNNGRWWFF